MKVVRGVVLTPHVSTKGTCILLDVNMLEFISFIHELEQSFSSNGASDNMGILEVAWVGI